MKNEIKRVKELIQGVLKKHGVKKASLFGSLARGKATKKSDVDLLIEFRGEKSLLDLVGLKIELEELLKKDVDVLTYSSLNPKIKRNILREQVPLL